MSEPENFHKRMATLQWIVPLMLICLTILDLVVENFWFAQRGGSVLNIATAILLLAIIGPLFVVLSLTYLSQELDKQEKLEEQYLTNQNKLAQVITTAADAILSTNLDGKIETWNRGAELLLDYTFEEIIGRPFSTLFGESVTARVETQWLIDTVRREDFLRRHVTTCITASRQVIDVELTVSLIRNKRGEPNGISVILRDVTTRKKREAEMQRLTTRLNHQASTRTQELAEKVEQLARANAELTQLDQTRSDFVSLVSHQIRAPLTNMSGALQRMQTDCGAKNPICTRMFVIFEEQIARLNHLVQNVLNAARIEAGEIFLQLEPISMQPLVQQALQQVYLRAPTRSIQIVDKPGLPMVLADRDQTIEVLSNLLDNADKYSPTNEEIIIELRADQGSLTIAIRDHGSGLPPDGLKSIFEKFHRIDSSDAQMAYGYGLGLYICRRLVEAQHGYIWAENHPKGGAVFSFSLPVWQG